MEVTTTSVVHLICGEQGAGKTTLARKLACELPAVRFSLDEWIMDLFGRQKPPTLTRQWWTEHAELCSDVIWATCLQLFRLQTSVILDFGFTERAHRARLFGRVHEAGARAQLHIVTAERETRRKRVHRRNRDRPETFALEVTDEMFDGFPFEPPTGDERVHAIAIHS